MPQLRVGGTLGHASKVGKLESRVVHSVKKHETEAKDAAIGGWESRCRRFISSSYSKGLKA